MIDSKTVVVTGASSGLGRSTANYLLSLGYHVIGTAKYENEAQFSLDAHKKEGSFPLLDLDMNKKESIDACMDMLRGLTKKIDVLVNNAGVGIAGPIEEIPLKKVREHFDTNFFGQLYLIQQVLPIMRKQGSGRIINVTSIAGYMGLPFRGIYSAAKSSFIIMSEALRLEVASFGIQLTTIAPGDYATNIGMHRYHSPSTKASPYYQMYKQSLENIEKHVFSGNNPIEVARKIAKLVQKRKVKAHYSVGSFAQKFSLVLKRLLPDKIYEKILKKYYKL